MRRAAQKSRDGKESRYICLGCLHQTRTSRLEVLFEPVQGCRAIRFELEQRKQRGNSGSAVGFGAELRKHLGVPEWEKRKMDVRVENQFLPCRLAIFAMVTQESI